MPAKRINILLVFAAEEGPLKELIRSNETCGIGWMCLTLNDALENGKDFTSHFSRLGHCELKEEHGDITIDLVSLARVLSII